MASSTAPCVTGCRLLQIRQRLAALNSLAQMHVLTHPHAEKLEPFFEKRTMFPCAFNFVLSVSAFSFNSPAFCAANEITSAESALRTSSNGVHLPAFFVEPP